MGRLSVGRMLVTGSVVTSGTAVRVGVGGARLALARAPALLRLGLAASLGAGPAAGRSQAAFRDDLVGLFRQLAENAWRELRRGVEDLDEFTRPPARAAAPGLTENGALPRRHRVKP